MTDFVYLQGSEAVSKAGYNMVGAADQMERVVSILDMTLNQFQLRLYEFSGLMMEFLDRLEKIYDTRRYQEVSGVMESGCSCCEEVHSKFDGRGTS